MTYFTWTFIIIYYNTYVHSVSTLVARSYGNNLPVSGRM